MKAKTRVRHTGMKSQAMAIVVLMITVLSAYFLYNIIRYNKKEIEDITTTYDKLIKRSYNVSQIHMAYPYRAAMQQFLASEELNAALSVKERTKLSQLTLSFLNSLGKRLSSSLEKMNWYTADGSLLMEITPEKQVKTTRVTRNPLAFKVINSKSEYEEFFVAASGLCFRQIKPVIFSPNDSAAGAFEMVLQSENLLETIDKVLGLNLTLIKTGDADNLDSAESTYGTESTDSTDSTSLAANPLWKKIKGGYYMKRETPAPELEAILDQVDATNLKKEIAFDKKIYFAYPHIEVADFDGNPAAKIISLQDITRAKGKINHSIFLIIMITAVILTIVFLILYLSFGKLMGRLQEREKQLELINKELEAEINERKEMEAELTTHRDHLEDMIAEGTRELEIKSQEIESNEKKLRTITSAIQDALIMLDNHGDILFWNPAAERMFGYTPDELQGKDFFQHIVPVNDYKKIAATLEELRKTKTDRTEPQGYGKIIEIECKRDDGRLFPAELMLTLVEIQDKPHLISLVRDITQKKAEETEKRILLRSVEQSSVGIEITDTDGIIQYVNPKFTEITGYERDEVIGKRAGILKSDFNPDEIYRDLWATITSGKDWHGELYNMKKSGALYWDSTLISPIKDAEGNITHFVAIKEDITERKNIEDELREAKESAEAASRSKGEFLANMSHEIRTPMNAIIGMTELALGTPLNVEQREYLDIVQQASRSLLKLLNDILDFSKVDAGKLILEPNPFNLRKLLGETTRTLAIQTHEKNLELVYYIDQAVPDLLIGDAGRLRQIIVNLIGNSIKFTEKGEIVLRIEVLEEGIEGKILLHFTVSDTGIGIAQDLLGTIFEQFSQADSSTTRKYGGTGLGLAISSRLVEMMGGVIWAESPSTFPHSNRFGPGSTFHFTILSEQGKETPEQHPGLEIRKLKDLSLLIVDDNETNRRFLQEALTKYGLKPETAASGPEALELLQAKPVDPPYFQLILLDFRMPDMDGGTVLKKIRRELRLNIPVILLTSGVLPEDLAEFKRQEAAAHLLKPVNSQELLETILEVRGHKTRDEKREEPVTIATEPTGTEVEILNILVAEDNAINQRLIRRLLEKAGHHVEIAPDGKAAVETFIKKAGNPEEKYHLILMDIQMPVMDGITAAREIRKIDKEIPIIALTAHAMKGDKNRFLSEGMDDYISKPIERALLFKIIEKHKHRKPGSAADATLP